MNRRDFFTGLAAFLHSLCFWRKAEPAPPTDWLEDEFYPVIYTISIGHSWDDNIIAIENCESFCEGDILHIPRTGENLRIASPEVLICDGFKARRVVRGIGCKPAWLNRGEPIWLLGNASPVSYEQELAQLQFDADFLKGLHGE